MAKHLNVPSVQHLARMWRDDPLKVCKACVDVVKNPPIFSYRPVLSATTDMLLFDQPFDELVQGIRKGERREHFQLDFIELLKLVREHFHEVTPDYVQAVTTRYYAAGRGLLVPFRPPVFYGLAGETHLPWLSFWKRAPLAGKQLSLCVTLIREIQEQDPDLEDAIVDILDFSAPSGEKQRALDVVSAVDVPLLSNAEKTEMLEIFAEGFQMAQKQLASTPAEKSKSDGSYTDDRQGELFDLER